MARINTIVFGIQTTQFDLPAGTLQAFANAGRRRADDRAGRGGSGRQRVLGPVRQRQRRRAGSPTSPPPASPRRGARRSAPTSATMGTTKPYQPSAANESQLVSQLSAALAGVKSCSFDLSDVNGKSIKVDTTQALAMANVMIEGTTDPAQNATNGWNVDPTAPTHAVAERHRLQDLADAEQQRHQLRLPLQHHHLRVNPMTTIDISLGRAGGAGIRVQRRRKGPNWNRRLHRQRLRRIDHHRQRRQLRQGRLQRHRRSPTDPAAPVPSTPAWTALAPAIPVSAQPVPLDLYFLMDSSKSMNDRRAPGRQSGPRSARPSRPSSATRAPPGSAWRSSTSPTSRPAPTGAATRPPRPRTAGATDPATIATPVSPTTRRRPPFRLSASPTPTAAVKTARASSSAGRTVTARRRNGVVAAPAAAISPATATSATSAPLPNTQPRTSRSGHSRGRPAVSTAR